MLRLARLLKRITAFNNPAFAKNFRATLSNYHREPTGSRCSRSHCFAGHLFLPGVTFWRKWKLVITALPHCFRKERERGENRSNRTKRASSFVSNFFSLLSPPGTLRGNFIGHLSPGNVSQSVVGRALLDLPVREPREKGLAATLSYRFFLSSFNNRLFSSSSPEGSQRNPV